MNTVSTYLMGLWFGFCLGNIFQIAMQALLENIGLRAEIHELERQLG